MEWKRKGRKGKERKGKERKGKERKGKERKGRKGKERKGKERKGKERKNAPPETGPLPDLTDRATNRVRGNPLTPICFKKPGVSDVPNQQLVCCLRRVVFVDTTEFHVDTVYVMFSTRFSWTRRSSTGTLRVSGAQHGVQGAFLVLLSALLCVRWTRGARHSEARWGYVHLVPCTLQAPHS